MTSLLFSRLFLIFQRKARNCGGWEKIGRKEKEARKRRGEAQVERFFGIIMREELFTFPRQERKERKRDEHEKKRKTQVINLYSSFEVKPGPDLQEGAN